MLIVTTDCALEDPKSIDEVLLDMITDPIIRRR